MKFPTSRFLLVTLLFGALLPSAPMHGAEAKPAKGSSPSTLSDTKITHAIETELRLDEGVAAHLIDVSTKDGVVTLSGDVGHILSKDRALALARTIKGVRSVVDRIEVKPVQRRDKEILQDVQRALLRDPATESFEVEATVSEGIVTLKGTVDSYAERIVAGQVVKGVRGAVDVYNNLKVMYPETRSVDEIRADVRRRLEADVWVDASLIEVKVVDSTVRLSGMVGSAAEKRQAMSDAWVAGIQSVDAEGLEVNWRGSDRERREKKYISRTRREVERSIRDALEYDPRVQNSDIEVSVEDGVATLSGKVDNLQAKLAAAEDADNTMNVWRVKNHLRVRPQKQRNDVEVEADVRAAIERDPYLDRFDINVHVDNSKARLYGNVDTKFQKKRATQVASRVRGVAEVANLLAVPPREMGEADWEIEEDIEDELFWSPYVNEDSIQVEVHDGIATLRGTVQGRRELEAVTQASLDGGARRVVNELKVKNGPRKESASSGPRSNAPKSTSD